MKQPRAPRPFPHAGSVSDYSLVAKAVALALAMLPLHQKHAQAQSLPVPCLAGSCANTPFLTSGSAAYSSSGTQAVVTQHSDRAILNWRSFNVAAGHEVRFDQPSASSAALNRIFQQDPSLILGSLQANGQVYLINSNGVIFGQGAQVNVGALVASTLDVSDEVFNVLGLTGAINAGDSVSALPAFEGGSDASIRVEAGADLRAGERIILVGAEVTNAGTLRTPDGQTILVGARDKVYVAADRDLRGLLVEVASGGTVTNLGEILTDRGNTTLAGLVVNQEGRIRATTSVNVNGSIRLLARDGANPSLFRENQGTRVPQATRTGELVIGSGSETLVLPDAGEQTAVDGQSQPLSSIEAMGRTIHIRPDALLRATGGNIALSAVSSAAQPGFSDAARLSLGSGAILDVSGDDTAVVAMERNQGRLKLFGNELADAPALRDGPLARQEISVDLRKGTPLTDLSRLQGDIRRGVGERLSAGGSVNIVAEGDVMLQPGSVIDVSGGQVRYRDGVISTTKLIADGNIVDISRARPDVDYDGIVGTETRTLGRWGVQSTWVSAGGEFQAGYVEGKDAGSVSIDAGALSLSGELFAHTASGAWQRNAAAGTNAGVARSYDQRPLGGALEISTRQSVASGPTVLFSNSPAGQAWTLQDGIAADQPLIVPTELFAGGGFSRLSLVSGGEIRLPEDIDIDLAHGGEFSLSANRILIDGDLRARSGRLRFTASQSNTAQGLLQLGSTASLDVSGGWTNDRPAVNGGVAGAGPIHVDGGSISLASQGDLLLDSGSQLSADAGAHVGADGHVRYGEAGSLSLSSSIPGDIRPTRLVLDGALSAWGFGSGGLLSLRAADIAIGAAAEGSSADPLQRLRLAPEFFDRGGFSHYQLLADRGPVNVEAGTQVVLSPESLVLTEAAVRTASADSVLAVSSRQRLPQHLQSGSSFSAAVQRNAQVADDEAFLQVGQGAGIRVDNGGSIRLASDSNLTVAGDLVARGGSVELSLTLPDAGNEQGYDPSQAIRITATGLLDVSGVSETYLDDKGWRRGEVLAGGTVAIDADRGFVFAGSGAQVNLSGATGILDVPGSNGPAPQRVDSDAGRLDIESAEGGIFSASVDGRGGDSSSANASLRFAIDGNQRDPEGRVAQIPSLPQFSTDPRQIVVGGSLLGYYGPGQDVPDSLRGRIHLDANLLASAPFDSVELHAAVMGFGGTSGEIRFNGDVSLDARRRIALDAGVIESGGGRSRISAATVEIGPSGQILRPAAAAPVAGSGTMQVNAQHIDLVGNVTLRGFGSTLEPAVRLHSEGDIRARGVRFQSSPAYGYSGSLRTASGLELVAQRIYPATLSEYTISAEGGNADVIFRSVGSADVATPLSALGSLRVTARDILQHGHLLAPFGSLSLEASRTLTLGDGSLTSVSGDGAIVPLGISEFGENWTYPLVDATRILEETPEKRVLLRAPSVDLAAGSTVDISGGGDLLTYEFIRGPGGSRDILLGDNPEGAFAIVPSLGSQYGAFDPRESGLAELPIDGTVTLAGGNGLPAGTYAILPARYALLPGAYLVTPVDGFQDLPPGAPVLMPDGISTVVAGRSGYAGTTIQDSRWSGFKVETAAQVRQRAEYSVVRASEVFAEAGGAQPGDAGTLVVDALDRVQIDGALAASAASGARGAFVDIVASRLAVVEERGQSPGSVELVSSELGNFAAASLLLGGTRTVDQGTVTISTNATSVSVADGAQVEASELMLVARDSLTVQGGAGLRGAGTASGRAMDEIALAGGGALLRLSSGDQVDVTRSAAGAAGAGMLAIDAGASLAASGSLTFEASGTLRSAGAIDAQVASVSFTADRISIGDTGAAAAGLVLSTEDIAGLGASELRLNSRSDIEFGGNVTIDVPELRLDATALRATGAVPASVALQAGQLEFRNSGTTAAAAPAAGSGTLSLAAESIRIGGGAKAVSGFASVGLDAATELTFEGAGSLQIGGELGIDAPVIHGSYGADHQVVVTGSLTTAASPGDRDPEAAGLGARLAFSASSIVHGGHIELPSGMVDLTATGPGGLTMAGGSVTDVSGRSYLFDTRQIVSPGGVIDVEATQGDLRILAGARLDASAAGGEGGALRLASAGTTDIEGAATLTAEGEVSGGEFTLAATRLAADFSQLNRQLEEGGFTGLRDVALGQGDILLGADETLTAREVRLAASGGRIEIGGTVNGGAEQGARVSLAARDDVRIGSAGRIDASGSATGAAGGHVELSTSDGSVDILGRIDTQRNDGDGGTLHVRAPRVGDTGVAIQDLGAQRVAADRIDVEAVRVYEGTTLDQSVMNAMAADSAAYMANAGQIRAGLGTGTDERVRLRPGQELRSAGQLTVNGDLDFAGQRFDGQAGVLTLRAAGDLVVNGRISDGVAQQEIVPFYPREVVQDGESWSYRLVAGADIASADALATRSGGGDLTLASGARVRTGTGDIDLAAGGDLRFAADASIYTTGRNRGTGGYGADTAEILLRGDFLEQGGDVRVAVRGDIDGVTSSYAADFLPRAAGEYILYRPEEILAYARAVDIAKFRQGIGALGGGDVDIRAGGDIASLTVALPTNRRPDSDTAATATLAGGGDLDMRAGGDIRGGSIVMGAGEARIGAAGSIGAAGAALPFVLQLDDAQVQLGARTGIDLGAVISPGAFEADPLQGLQDFFIFSPNAYAFGYTDRSAIEADTLVGDVRLAADANALKNASSDRSSFQVTAPLTVYPGTLRATSLEGDVVVSGAISLFPSATGQLELLAGRDVTADIQIAAIRQSDADRTLLPTMTNPAIYPTEAQIQRALDAHAATPVHLNDHVPALIVARDGSIGTSPDRQLTLSVAKQARLSAGQDIQNLTLQTQHSDPNDITTLHAGRDIVYRTIRTPDGRLRDSQADITVAGPGAVELLAGRHIDLGTSEGLLTRGDLENPALADRGADIRLWAGLAAGMDGDAFIDRYLRESQAYEEELAAYLVRVGAPAGGEDLARFEALDERLQRAFLMAVFFNELQESGVEATTTGDFSRGFDAIATLFPEEEYQGDVRSFLSQISTLDGGDISIVVPGGLINAGVASSGTITKQTAQLGIIAQRDGHVRTFTDGDFLVNASRVFALDGGDILAWSSNGDIDAGRGARSALQIPPPVVRFDAQGNTVLEFPPAVAGSGIRTAVSTAGRDPGDVYLFAPEGVVNAGDAGIESAGNITVAAERVIGADNISFGGTAVGVPVDAGGLAAGLTSASATASSAGNTSTGMSEGQSAPAETPVADAALGWLEVFVEGFGEEVCKPDDQECLERQQD